MTTASEVIACCSGTTKCPRPDAKIWEVFSEDHYKSISETEFFVVKNINPKNIEKCMQYFQSEFPLVGFPHLKRIRGRDILICPSDGDFSQKSIEEKIFSAFSNKNISCEEIEIAKVFVSKNPVLTKQQYSVANGLWPVRLTVPLVDTETSFSDKKVIDKFQVLFDNQAECMFEKNGIMVFGTCADRASPNHYKHAILNACASVGPVSDYLATDFEVFLLSEPCLMCSMALLHSRVARVYYLVHHRFEETKWGGLGSICSIHANKQLNHRFQVFRVVVD